MANKPCPRCGSVKWWWKEDDQCSVCVSMLEARSVHVGPLDLCAARVHEANKKWWIDLETGEPIDRNVGELLMLVTSELAEALEGHRKNLMDDKLPHRKMFEVEIVDAFIRLFDIAGGMHLDIGAAFEEKMSYNATRHDHSVEGRKAEGGKKY